MLAIKEESKSDDEAEQEEMTDAPNENQRGENVSHLPPVGIDNTLLIFGTKGGSGVNADTAMCLEISEIMMQFNRRDLRTMIPAAFENFKSQDASFETIVSSTSQILALNFRGNIVEKAVAVIFVTTSLDGY